MKFDAIFWDNDGVLVETEHLYFQANREVFRDMGVELTKELYQQFFLHDNTGTWHLIDAEKFPSDVQLEYRQKRGDVYSKLLESEDISKPLVDKVLPQLHGKVEMGIVTSCEKEHFQAIHRRTGFLPYFSFVVASGDYQISKPDPEPYLKALQISGFAPEKCLVIEDSQRGLLAAKAAGLECWVIPTELTRDSDFSRADRVLSDIGQLVGLLGLE